MNHLLISLGSSQWLFLHHTCSSGVSSLVQTPVSSHFPELLSSTLWSSQYFLIDWFYLFWFWTPACMRSRGKNGKCLPHLLEALASSTRNKVSCSRILGALLLLLWPGYPTPIPRAQANGLFLELSLSSRAHILVWGLLWAQARGFERKQC